MRQIKTSMTSERFNVIPVKGVNVVELVLPQFVDSDEFDRINESLLTMLGNKADARWIIDLSAVTYMGSSALGLMVNIRQKIKQAGGRLVICGLSRRLLEVFHTCCMERLFAIVPTREEAVTMCKPD